MTTSGSPSDSAFGQVPIGVPEPSLDGPMRVLLVNLWTRRPAKLARIVEATGLGVSPVNPWPTKSFFAQAPPDVVLFGFGMHNRTSAQFVSDYRSSSWFRRVPLLALVESRDESMLEFCSKLGCDDVQNMPFTSRLLRARTKVWALRHRAREKERRQHDTTLREKRYAEAFSKIIIPVGVAMMAQPDYDELLDMILMEAKKFCNADGGTLYLKQADGKLAFQIVHNDSLGLACGGKHATKITFPPLPLDEADDGARRHIASHAVLSGRTINVADVYACSDYDFSGARTFDEQMGYRTQSVLTIPLRSHTGQAIGALQLLNARDPEHGRVVAFDEILVTLTESLSMLAAQALESYRKMHALRAHVAALSIHVDEEQKEKQVKEIAGSDYFQHLKAKAEELRRGSDKARAELGA